MKSNELRLAAYFLIGHFCLLSGLAALGKGEPEYLRIAVSIGFLLGSVGALFSPRRRGWLMVVAFALHALSPFFVGLWTLWSSPGQTATMKVLATLVMLVINSLLLTALILVFKPSNFALFRNSDPEGAANDGAVVK